MTADRPRTAPPAAERVWSVEEHLADVLSRVRPAEPADRELLDAQGCVLAEDVTAPRAVPPFDNSSMDGYAVRAADVAGAAEHAPAALAVLGDVAAGSDAPPEVAAGSCVRIMTGAPLPPGADAVVPVEWTDGGAGEGSGPATGMRPASREAAAAGTVRVLRPAAAGAHIRRAGSDVPAGRPVLAAGTVLGPAQLGLAATVGRARVPVRRRPRVAVLSTGSELVPPGAEPGPGRIPDSNSTMLAAAARDAGADAVRIGAVPDEAEELRAVLAEQAARADLVVTSGGVSVGAYDVVKEVFEELGREAEGDGVAFRKLAMQPGKPQGFGPIGADGALLAALPGNPVSAYVSFELFVRPAIRRMLGLPAADPARPTVRARTPQALTSPPGRRQFLRGRYDPAAGTATPVGGSGSHLTGALALADCLIVVPEDTTAVEAGTELDVVLLRR